MKYKNQEDFNISYPELYQRLITNHPHFKNFDEVQIKVGADLIDFETGKNVFVSPKNEEGFLRGTYQHPLVSDKSLVTISDNNSNKIDVVVSDSDLK